jgi:predicted heme/steroid binding protein/uncharacterized membrane protein
MKEFTPEELARCNGENDAPTYVAYQGKVYDISNSKMWRSGLHMKRHRAGADLSTDIQAAPHLPDVLERFPQVGVLKAESEPGPELEIPERLARLLKRFPMLRRHPHPMTVHFPIVFVFATAFFTLLYLLTGVPSFEATALHCLWLGIPFTMVAISTGLYTWWLNYLSAPMRAVTIKKRLSLSLLTLMGILFVWRMADPAVITPVSGAGYLYLLLVLLMFLMVCVIGWFGAELTFPIERD